MKIHALTLAAVTLALTACGSSEEPSVDAPEQSAAASPATPTTTVDEVAAIVAEAIGGDVEPGPEVWAVSMDDSDATSACGGTVIDMADGNPYPDEVVITDPAGRFGVYLPSPDDAECLTTIGEALTTVGQ